MSVMDDVLMALQAPNRREILRIVSRGERSSGEIHRALGGLTFGAVSQHLGVLERAGLVCGRREGRSRYYAARREALLPLREWLDEMWGGALGRLKGLAEAEAGGRARPGAAGKRASRRGHRHGPAPRSPRRKR
jgi:DNA-binding transcriptional ArsR family regulator